MKRGEQDGMKKKPVEKRWIFLTFVFGIATLVLSGCLMRESESHNAPSPYIRAFTNAFSATLGALGGGILTALLLNLLLPSKLQQAIKELQANPYS